MHLSRLSSIAQTTKIASKPGPTVLPKAQNEVDSLPVDHLAPISTTAPVQEDLELSQPAPGIPLRVSDSKLGRVAYQGNQQEIGKLKDLLTAKGIQLWTIRHGESEMNAKKTRLPGQVETPLTARGRQQALEAAKASFQELGGVPWLREVCLEGKKAPAVYSSPLSRASDTAQIFVDFVAQQAQENGLELRLPVQKDPRLLEIDFGRYDGQLVVKAELEHPELLTNGNMAQRFPEGESRLDVLNRVSSFLTEVSEKHADQPVMLFCHLVPSAVARQLMGDGTVDGNGDLEIRRKDYPNAVPKKLTDPKPGDELGYLIA